MRREEGPRFWADRGPSSCVHRVERMPRGVRGRGIRSACSTRWRALPSNCTIC